jgi:hypothetical protein
MATMAALGDLPLLQDTTTDDMWNAWAVTYRDVVLLDGTNRVIGVYNLTSNDLNTPANFSALQSQITAALPP